MKALMSRFVRLTAGAAAATATLLAGSAASAQQVMCNDGTKLPDPIIVSGSPGFEAMLAQFAFKLAAETPPRTVLYAAGSAAGNCVGMASVASGTDLGGTVGYYYVPMDGA